eukprot:m.260220 g.260220  ORF g.260220 m.260220 type:complete len:233 (+) comp15984_c0_seq1:184-882(+)
MQAAYPSRLASECTTHTLSPHALSHQLHRAKADADPALPSTASPIASPSTAHVTDSGANSRAHGVPCHHNTIGEPDRNSNSRTLGCSYSSANHITDTPPSAVLSHAPTARPTASPTTSPTVAPPSGNPSTAPTATPTTTLTAIPSAFPTASPTANPTTPPTASPTASPTLSSTATPTALPTASPSAAPSATPSAAPSATPTASPTASPTATPTSHQQLVQRHIHPQHHQSVQ